MPAFECFRRPTRDDHVELPSGVAAPRRDPTRAPRRLRLALAGWRDGNGCGRRRPGAQQGRGAKSAPRDDAARAQHAVTRLLQQGLSADEAVQIALLNNLGLQAAYNDLGMAEAVYVQASRPPVPSFSISRISTSIELDIERQIVGSILSIATLPAGREIAGVRFEQAQLRAAEETLRVAAATRQRLLPAVASREIVTALSDMQRERPRLRGRSPRNCGRPVPSTNSNRHEGKCSSPRSKPS